MRKGNIYKFSVNSLLQLAIELNFDFSNSQETKNVCLAT